MIDRCDTSTTLRRQFDETFTGQTTDRFANRRGRQAPGLGQVFDRDAISGKKSTGQDFIAQSCIGQLGSRGRMCRPFFHPAHGENL